MLYQWRHDCQLTAHIRPLCVLIELKCPGKICVFIVTCIYIYLWTWFVYFHLISQDFNIYFDFSWTFVPGGLFLFAWSQALFSSGGPVVNVFPDLAKTFFLTLILFGVYLNQILQTLMKMSTDLCLYFDGEGGGAFSSQASIWGECSTVHSPPALFFFF